MKKTCDPVREMLRAGELFHQGHVEEGLACVEDLVRTLPPDFPAPWARELNEKVPIVKVAVERANAAVARQAKVSRDGSRWSEERWGQTFSTEHDLRETWNDDVIGPLVSALTGPGRE
jgi:hypothetical protein